jgi:aryl-alcohol dehydrogenase-like predicted oxidoreductase
MQESSMMQYRQLGNTDMNISRIAFGCMSLQAGDATNEQLIKDALDAGINYFDTADLYNNGANEEIVGRALRAHRAKVFIATKVGNQLKSDGSGWNWNPSKEYILEAVERSLQRLQTDHIDLYQLHGGTVDDPIDETIEAFELLKQQGKIRYYGISSIRPNVIREWVSRSGFSSVMMQYSLLDRRPEEEALPLLFRNNIGVLARGPMAQGLLVGKPAKDYLGRSAAEVADIAAIVKSRNVSPSALAVQYVLHHPSVTAAVVGIRTRKHLLDALGAMEAPPLTNGFYQELNDLSTANFYTDHR